ncbi:MAG: FAD-dependent oxidoreductase, partial [Lentisphaerae bacterium]|nr:FAD-dependent oxidoreductase [Lentisphaerota bacterium]
VENFPGFPDGTDGTALVGLMRTQAERFGARYVLDEVASSDFSGTPLKLVMSGGDALEAKAVIIATGASARYLGLGSEQALRGRGVSACATCDGAFFRNQAVAVVGGGDTAAEEALFLSRLCSSVTLIHRRDELRASKVMAARVLESEKIDVQWDSVVEDVLDVERGEVTGVRIKNVKSGEMTDLEVTGVFMAIGHTPNTAPFVDQVEMDDVGYIVASDTRTSAEGVFAAGDVQDPVYRQAVTAAGSGCMASLEAERYLGSLGA